jgi:hypothetical protein
MTWMMAVRVSGRHPLNDEHCESHTPFKNSMLHACSSRGCLHQHRAFSAWLGPNSRPERLPFVLRRATAKVVSFLWRTLEIQSPATSQRLWAVDSHIDFHIIN